MTIAYDDLYPCQERYYSSLVGEHLALPIQYIEGDHYPLLSPSAQATRPMELYQPGLKVDLERQALKFGRVMLTGSAGDNLLRYSPVLPTVAEANPLATLRQIFQLKARYGRFPGLGTGLKARLKIMAGKTVEKPSIDYYPPWLNEDLEQEYGMRARWDAHCAPGVPGAQTHPRHPLLYDSLISPNWNTDDFYMRGEFSAPEERDPFLDLRVVEFVLSLPPMPWLYKKHILRQSMSPLLPKAIVQRPKAPLGMLASTLLKQAALHKFQPGNDLLKYVNPTEFRKSITANNDPQLGGVNLRPVILEHWLQML
jgi:asparagine synthase (glutamine-hydrolysing)